MRSRTFALSRFVVSLDNAKSLAAEAYVQWHTRKRIPLIEQVEDSISLNKKFSSCSVSSNGPVCAQAYGGFPGPRSASRGLHMNLTPFRDDTGEDEPLDNLHEGEEYVER
jgi:hypothetical protein